MALLNNAVTIHAVRSVLGLTTRCHVLGASRLPRNGTGVVIASNHLSHYDPVCIGALSRRRIDWMSRSEFGESGFAMWLLRQSDAFLVDRHGSALSGIREALRRLRNGRFVGVFPEGELTPGADSVLNGGRLKGGAALLARWAPVAIVPCVVLGGTQFARLGGWLPHPRGRLWVGFGDPIHADPALPRGRRCRRELTARLETAMRSVYRELEGHFDIPRGARP